MELCHSKLPRFNKDASDSSMTLCFENTSLQPAYVRVQVQSGGIMEVCRSQTHDLKMICKIYENAKSFMAQNGNPTQWGKGYPNIELVKADIEKGGYVVVEDEQIVGAFVFVEDACEEVYDNIDGAWLNCKSYGVIHRCATSVARNGVGQLILEWCFNKQGNIRIDTHRNNLPMLNLLKKNGYEYCGKVQYAVSDGERLAFQKVNDNL